MVKKRYWLLVIGVLLSATHLFAGIRYEFQESTRIEETGKSTLLVARAVVEGDLSRLDVLSGNLYEPGVYMLTHGDNRIFVVRPEQKTYSEVSTSQRTVNPNQVKLTNPSVSFVEIPDDPPEVVAGYPTKHFRLNLSYDITVQMGTIAIKQQVRTAIDKWTTTAFDHLITEYVKNFEDLKTGNVEIDALIETEATKFQGLALKQRIQTITTAETNTNNPNVNLPTTRKKTRDMVVSKIEEVQVSPNYFAIPVDFEKNNSNKAPAAATHYLTMEPTVP